jgi:hypothetical protein
MIESKEIINLVSYFTKIHHIKGRLRVRVNPAIVKDVSGISLSDIERISTQISGIKNIKINPVVASVIIEYDDDIFNFQLWEELLNGKNIEFITSEINKLSDKVK